MSPDLAQNLDELLDRSLRSKLKEMADELAGSLREECSTLLDSAAEQARTEARAEAESSSGDAVDSLAESARRIRSAQAVTEIAAALVESAAGYCGRAALFIHRGDRALGFRAAGAVSPEMQLEFQKLSVEVASAPAIEQVMNRLESRECSGDEGELGGEIAALLQLSPEDRVLLLPVALRDKVLAVLYLDPRGHEGEQQPVQTSAIEILVALTEAWIEAVGNRRKLAAA
ncbi:MAG: hypothetical protein KDC27_16490 [Acidobacteria bacterium]|nr:hypothetical protein [Acidobacteriota bacterium]